MKPPICAPLFSYPGATDGHGDNLGNHVLKMFQIISSVSSNYPALDAI